MKKPNVKLMNTVHSEARITTGSKILNIVSDVTSMDYFAHRIVEAVKTAGTDPNNADEHLLLATQLCTIMRTKMREAKTMLELTAPLTNAPDLESRCTKLHPLNDRIRCTLRKEHRGDCHGTDDSRFN